MACSPDRRQRKVAFYFPSSSIVFSPEARRPADRLWTNDGGDRGRGRGRDRDRVSSAGGPDDGRAWSQDATLCEWATAENYSHLFMFCRSFHHKCISIRVTVLRLSARYPSVHRRHCWLAVALRSERIPR